MIDKKAIEEHVKGILVALGEDPEREGLKETPQRVARMYEEVFQGIAYSNSDIAKMFGKTFEAPANAGPVIVRDIEVFSYCEHHMALMYDMSVSVAYIPKDRVIGLSKIARICDMAAKRLQLQERLGSDIAEIMSEATGSPDVGVVIAGTHSCLTARGIKNTSAKTETKTYLGRFKTEQSLKDLLK
ncbi:GTP cyclohydrolase I FolE [Ruminococcus sp. FC2018]|uniref:GTP cyclohydrolase I FolE n=1 Tax=Ruminococcus sp. FC2018 TaxID=1410617 RepID=UPI000490FEC1|nr:GTP cyclohydrolase I FolE [Ruminococcus sp. FC2018]